MGTGTRCAEEAHVRLLEKPENIDALIALFEAIAQEQGWQPGDQMRAYREHSVYFGAYVGNALAGGLHLVLGGTDSLPVLTVWPELCLHGRRDVADVALVGVKREFRARHDLLWQLFLTLWAWCDTQGIEELWAEVPAPRLRLYNRLGWNLRAQGPPRLHWAEPCLPCRAYVRELAQSFAAQAQTSPAYRSRLVQAQKSRAPLIGLPALPDLPALSAPWEERRGGEGEGA